MQAAWDSASSGMAEYLGLSGLGCCLVEVSSRYRYAHAAGVSSTLVCRNDQLTTENMLQQPSCSAYHNGSIFEASLSRMLIPESVPCEGHGLTADYQPGRITIQQTQVQAEHDMQSWSFALLMVLSTTELCSTIQDSPHGVEHGTKCRCHRFARSA